MMKTVKRIKGRRMRLVIVSFHKISGTYAGMGRPVNSPGDPFHLTTFDQRTG